MGGIGSGNRHRFSKKATTEETQSLDVRYLHRGATEAQRRRRFCEFMFELEGVFREGGGGRTDLVYDAERDLYHFPDGRFALSREHADWPALKEAGFFAEWGM